MTIRDGTVVEIEFSMHLGDGTVIDCSDPNEPMCFVHGLGQLVPGLERGLAGMRVGESKSIVIAPEQGWGGYDPTRIREISRDAFLADVDARLEVGMRFMATDGDGEEHPFRVVEVRTGAVLADFNHPLAGKTLHYEVAVLSIRDLTHEDVEAARKSVARASTKNALAAIYRGGHGPWLECKMPWERARTQPAPAMPLFGGRPTEPGLC